MNFGVAIFPTEDAQGPAELARMAEDRGFESLLFPEHTHIPASRDTPYPAGGELPPIAVEIGKEKRRASIALVERREFRDPPGAAQLAMGAFDLVR